MASRIWRFAPPVPLLLVVLAIAASAVLAYGVNPNLAQLDNGLRLITLSRRLMWPLVAVSLLLCVWLLGLVISGRHTTWWLIGLAPVLALFVHRFTGRGSGPAAVVESPLFVTSDDARVPEPGDYVVGLRFEGRDYAFPYKALYTTPVVGLVDYDKRMLLLWSAYANRALAVTISRDLKVRDLEVVSSPANSLLVYDRRLGQFIIGVTGRLADGSEVAGFQEELPTWKGPWSAWRGAHPATLVMLPARSSAAAPTRPILPQYKLRAPPVPDALTPVSLLATTQPAAIAAGSGPDAPLGVTIGQTRVLIVRDPRTKRLRAFDRRVKDDLFLTFSVRQPDRKFPDAVLVDSDTLSLWTIDGRAVDGPLKGEQLRRIGVEDGLYWGVMKHWYPDLQLITQ